MSRNQAEGLYIEWSVEAIYFIMIPVVICFIKSDGKIEIDKIFQAWALYYVLQLSMLWCLSDCLHILYETQVSLQRVKVSNSCCTHLPFLLLLPFVSQLHLFVTTLLCN